MKHHNPGRFCCRLAILICSLVLWHRCVPSVACAAEAVPAAPLSRQEAQQLLDVLNDPKQREAFTRTLSLMARGLPAAPTSPVTVKKNDASLKVDQDLGNGLMSLREETAAYGRNFFGLFRDLGLVGHWMHLRFTDPALRHETLDALTGALIVVLIGLVVERGLVLGLRKPLTRLTERASSRDRGAARVSRANVLPDDGTRQKRADDQRRQIETLRFLARVPYAFGHFGLKVLPVLVFLALAYLATWLLPWSDRATTVTLTLTDSYAIARVLYLMVETALAPRSPTIRLLPARDSTARMVTRWWNVLVAAPALIICLSVLGQEFDLAPRATAAMIRAVVLIEHILIAAFIWRVRHIVANALQPARVMGERPFWTFVGAVARLWWVPAMFLDISLWVVWAAHLRGGYMWILQATGMTVAALILSRLTAVLAYGWQDRLFRVSPALAERMPELQKRADRYYPLARGVLTGMIVFATLVTISEAWGLPTIAFFLHNSLGARLLEAAITMLLAGTVAVGVWEMVNGLLNRQLTRFEHSEQASRATRLRTVLPIIRTVLLALIVIVVAVTTLSQIGLNVAPLLTGAGILGAAIAFGSQSLVKDFITGFFMLVEDAIQVGDWVTTGGVSGTVENLSIRTVKVRDVTGDLHIIPFSSVSSIANTARGYNQIIIHQQVDLSEDLPRVTAIMADAVREMRKDDVFGPMILSDYLDLGVDRSDSGGAMILGAIRTVPMMKWKVQREFYRRIANPFAAASIKFYTPTSYYTTPPDGPMHLVSDDGSDAVTPVEPRSAQMTSSPEASASSSA